MFDGSLGTLVAVTFFICLLAWPAWIAIRKRSSVRDAFNSRESFLAVVMVLVFLGAFFLLPQQIPGQNLIYQRLAVLFLIGLIILGALLGRRMEGRTIKLVIGVISMCFCLLWLDYYAEFDRENQSFDHSVLPRAGTQGRLGGLIYGYTYRGHPVYIHFPNYHVVWNQGIATSTMIDYRFGSVRRRANLVDLPPYNPWIAKSYGYDGRYNHLEYILVRGRLPARAAQSLSHFAITDYSGPWKLFKGMILPQVGNEP
jgi:hypothetical protein